MISGQDHFIIFFMEIQLTLHLISNNQLRNDMKSIFTSIIILSVLANVAEGQEKQPKLKRPGLKKDSVYAYQVIPNSGNPLVSTMPLDTGISGNVKMPNSYRNGGLEPVSMPTHRLKLMMLKRKGDTSGKSSIQPVPLRNTKVYPVKPKN
jgi:hypothetical protein